MGSHVRSGVSELQALAPARSLHQKALRSEADEVLQRIRLAAPALLLSGGCCHGLRARAVPEGGSISLQCTELCSSTLQSDSASERRVWPFPGMVANTEKPHSPREGGACMCRQ